VTCQIAISHFIKSSWPLQSVIVSTALTKPAYVPFRRGGVRTPRRHGGPPGRVQESSPCVRGPGFTGPLVRSSRGSCCQDCPASRAQPTFTFGRARGRDTLPREVPRVGLSRESSVGQPNSMGMDVSPLPSGLTVLTTEPSTLALPGLTFVAFLGSGSRARSKRRARDGVGERRSRCRPGVDRRFPSNGLSPPLQCEGTR
jgi:hypothetical protein